MRYSPSETTVMILAAGRGKRMLPLTASTPKPLLKVGHHSLIEHHLLRLADSGFKHIVINHAYLGSQIVSKLGDGHQFNLSIRYSDESASGALETAGGIINALEKIESDPFLIINGDIYTDFNFTSLLDPLPTLARLVLVDNPDHNLGGDFEITESSLQNDPLKKFTYSGIGLYRKALFKNLEQGSRPLAPILFKAIENQQLDTRLYKGIWHDVGTPERLTQLNAELA